MERERFILPKGASFYDLYEDRNEANIGEMINVALEKIGYPRPTGRAVGTPK